MCNAKFDWETMKDHPGYREGPLKGNERIPVTFDMSQCKNGDRLRTREGNEMIYIGPINVNRHAVYNKICGLAERHSNGTEPYDPDLDIIGFAPRIVKCEAWVNLYKREKGLVEIFSSKDAADNDAVPSRLECRHIEWSYEEEQ